MIKKEEWQDLSELFLFENHLQDEKAGFITVSDGYLWRRDDVRLIAYKIQNKMESILSYPVSFFEKKPIIEFHLDEKGNIVASDEDGQVFVQESQNVPYLTHSIQALSYTSFDMEVKVLSKQIAKSLLSLHRKLSNFSDKLHDVTVTLHVKKGMLSVESDGEKWDYPLDITIVKGGGIDEITYSYLFFKDFLFNANSFGKEIFLKVTNPYFTVIQYNESLYGVINHKRKNNN